MFLFCYFSEHQCHQQELQMCAIKIEFSCLDILVDFQLLKKIQSDFLYR